MSRPLVISDCDEVLLHMIGPFRAWLGEAQGVTFRMGGNDFARSMTWTASGDPVAPAEIWRLLDLFFTTEMHRQVPIAGAVEAIGALGEVADVVVLTNLGDHHQARRTDQLRGHGLALKVYTNLGPKGPALRRIVEEYRPSRAVFIDDIAQHHGSAAEHVPTLGRLHFCGEPELAPLIPCARDAGHAHARIDHWAGALPWLLDRLTGDPA
ncbi:HAD family hydrolase [Novosphingobium piscinae]|uniref:HAD family hydrolase n=1 Tax=Novosphingobium piscinae TaxID=1507448 RepID=A0A7X1G0U6_9SPHN|nr:HAD family hydrolase [Novosphingobium piscinae]MBC2670525.1 HAD family hydrolase [Novosphingobium piscinae]